MKRYLYLTVTLVFLMLWSSCRKDFEFSASTGSLHFSRDTVYLDTVFTNIGSSTYNLKVYNKSKEDIFIPSVKLALGEASNYRLSVDGMTGKTFENVEILSKDSLFIFIETTIDIQNTQSAMSTYLYTDQIEFDTGSKQQKVELVTLVQDAVFIHPNRDNTTKVVETLTLNMGGDLVETDLQGRELLPEELHFTNEKPYLIYGFATVPPNETLTIDAGSRLHFHENSGIIISDGASLHVNGTYSPDQETLNNEVVFEGDRLESRFSETPGQWGSIWFLEGSINNQINYATIKNATVGLLSDGNPNEVNTKLNISNCQIYNSSAFGILGRNTSIAGENVVINNAGQSSFAGTLGGKYNFKHATIVNYWNNGFRQLPAVLLNNFSFDEETIMTVADLTDANFSNCIIYGNDNREILVDEHEDASVIFNFKFTNCLIRFENTNNGFSAPAYDLNNETHYVANIYNQDPHFKDPEKNALIIGEESAAINNGLLDFALEVPNDLLNVDRTNAPDTGAYQHIIFPEDD